MFVIPLNPLIDFGGSTFKNLIRLDFKQLDRLIIICVIYMSFITFLYKTDADFYEVYVLMSFYLSLSK